ncbi:TonB-dependent siderophore receptor [Marinagarivorans algicola]|uniref:TonB-dependent siderophore receptor n=1 Tax=Marinagarivorans algicola TaxID=1513270 RepID=UPI003735BEE5
MKNQFTQTMLFCCTNLYLLTSNHAIAEDNLPQKYNNTHIETITVTGVKQAYKGDFATLETPQSELIIDDKLLQYTGAQGLTQALDLSASVARQNNFGGLWNSFAIRGFVGDENLPSNYLVNGFNAGRGFGGARDLSGIEAVEVLKGPRAALLGRGEPGGTINLITKRPTFETSGSLNFSAGSFNTYRADIDYTTTASQNIAMRLVGFYEDADSFRDTIETNKQGLSPSVTWQINDKNQLTYALEYSHQSTPFDRGITAVNGNLNALPISRFLGEPGDGPMEADVLGHQLEFQRKISQHWNLLAGFSYRDTNLEGFATENGFYGGRQFLQRDGKHLTRFRRYRDYNANHQAFRVEANGSFFTGHIQHRLIAGLDTDDFKNDQVFLRARGSAIDDTQPIENERIRLATTNQIINVFNPIYGAYILPVPSPNTDRLEHQKSQGLFIQDQLSLTDKLDIRIGARIDKYQQTLNNRALNNRSTYTDTHISPQLGIVYKTTESFSWYAVYGENFRPLSGATDENNLEPNQSQSTETGVKFLLNGGQLEANVAIFKVAQSNISTVDDDFNATAIGEAESQGFEFDLNGYITDTLSIWASYSLIKAETKNTFKDPNFGTEIPAGADLLNIPKNQFTLQLIQEVSLNEKTLSLIGGVTYVDKRNGFFSDQTFKLPSYSTFRLAAQYEVSNFLKISAEIRNAFDKKYYTNSFADVWVQPGAPRNARLSTTFRF